MTKNDDGNSVSGGDDLQALLSDAGARPQPSSAAAQAAFAELRAEWHAKAAAHRKQRQRRRLTVMSAAAVVVLAVFTTISWQPLQNPSWGVELASGDVTIDGQPISGTRGAATHTLDLQQGDVLSTRTAARLTLPSGTDLRLAAGSSVRWLNENSLYLSAGSAYVDTKNVSSFDIQTEFGHVRDIGTRYMVVLETGSMSVAVREGAARIESVFGTDTALAAAQHAAVVHIDRSGVQSKREPASAARWDWIHAVAPGYADRRVPGLLEAIGKDLGKRVDYSSHGVQAAVANATVQGSLAGMPPREALLLVTRSAGLTCQENDESIIVGFNP